MSDQDEQKPNLNQSTPAGTIGTHPSRSLFPIFVGTTTSNEFNTVKDPLVVIACWRMDDIRFDFSSSFVRPDSADEFMLLSVLMRAHPNAPLSLFGHADPVGEPEFNKRLSGRRAEAIYAVLVRDTARWERLYNNAEDKWGVRSIQLMLDKLGFPPGRTDGTMDAGTTTALRNFRAPGTNDAGTRQALFTAYMDAICKDINGARFVLTASDFLGRGADPDGRVDFQGCSEFNPVLMFSKVENDAYTAATDKTARDADNQPNRRVDGFLFRPGSVISPGVWPCPAAKSPTAQCQTRLYANHATRLSFQANRREHAALNNTDNDTFGCRFFDLVADRSPCLGGRNDETIKVVFQRYPGLAGSDADRGIGNVPYNLRVIGMSERTGRTAADGSIDITMPVNGTAVVDIFSTQYIVSRRDSIEALTTMQGQQRRMVMLGYQADAVDGTVDVQTDDAIQRVQADNNLDTHGEIETSAGAGFDLTTGATSAAFQSALRNWVGE